MGNPDNLRPSPAHIGPYRTLLLLGEGGLGVVYLAEQEAAVRREVALKVIKPGMDSREVLARFESERQALAIGSWMILAIYASSNRCCWRSICLDALFSASSWDCNS